MFSSRKQKSIFLSSMSAVVGLLALYVFVTLAAAGDLDPSFAGNGVFTDNIAGTHTQGNDVIVQPDGKIVVGGATNSLGNSALRYAIARFNPDGSLDTSFSNDGINYDINIRGIAAGLALYDDGKIAQCGFGPSGFTLFRYSSSGVLDTSFGLASYARLNIFGGATEGCESLAIQPNDKIIAAGWGGSNTDSDVVVARFTISGTLDTSFDSDGHVTLDIVGEDDQASDVLIQPNGKIVIAGNSVNSGVRSALLARFDGDGTLDTTFGVNGVVIPSFGASGPDVFVSIVQLENGQLLVTGSRDDGSQNDIILLRYSADGAIDTTFGTNGVVVTPIGSNYSLASGLAVQSSGKIIVTGSTDSGSNNDVVVIRYLSNGSLDPDFGTGGVMTLDLGFNDEAFAVDIQADGRIVVTGSAENVSNEVELLVARLFGSGNPIAAAGSDQDVVQDTLVMLDGRASTDPDGSSSLFYAWTQTGGTAVSLSDTDVPTPTFTAPQVNGPLTFSLVVTNSLDLVSTPDTVVVTVHQAPSAVAGSDKIVPLGAGVTLDGSSSSDPDGELPLSYQWLQTGGISVTLSDETAVSPTFTAPNYVTDLIFTLTVTDDAGLESLIDEVVVDVRRVIYLPSIISPQ